MVETKEAIVTQLYYCKAIADDIIKHNATDDIIAYAKKWAEIESPMTGETNAPWIRINWGDIYAFILLNVDSYYNDGIIKFIDMEYQLDPYGAYGAELIVAYDIYDFMDKLDRLTEDEILEVHYAEDYSQDIPRPYRPYESCKC